MAFLDYSGLQRFFNNLKGKFLSLDKQVLTEEQKTQVKLNIGISNDGETLPEVYVGEGDMPAGYTVQIDPSAQPDVYSIEEIDSKFSAVEDSISNRSTTEETQTLINNAIAEIGNSYVKTTSQSLTSTQQSTARNNITAAPVTSPTIKSSFTLQGDGLNFYFQNTNMVRGSTDNTTTYMSAFNFIDKNGYSGATNRLGYIGYLDSATAKYVRMKVNDPTNTTSETSTFFEFGYKYSSSTDTWNPYTLCNTPSSTSDSSTQIATTKWVQNVITAKLYTSSQIDTKLAGYYTSDQVYTKAEVDALIAKLLTTSQYQTDINNAMAVLTGTSASAVSAASLDDDEELEEETVVQPAVIEQVVEPEIDEITEEEIFTVSTTAE